jgi:hypothetical protein
MKKAIFPISIAAAVLLLGGCVFAPGDSGHYGRDMHEAQPTLGQELLDLDKARNAGVISQAEFESAKNRLLDRR